MKFIKLTKVENFTNQTGSAKVLPHGELYCRPDDIAMVEKVGDKTVVTLTVADASSSRFASYSHQVFETPEQIFEILRGATS